MAGFGRFKLTDAIPDAPELAKSAPAGKIEQAVGSAPGSGSPRKGKAAKKAAAANMTRETRESAQAKNSEASTRDRMVDIGRGNQQAGRQKAK